MQTLMAHYTLIKWKSTCIVLYFRRFTCAFFLFSIRRSTLTLEAGYARSIMNLPVLRLVKMFSNVDASIRASPHRICILLQIKQTMEQNVGYRQ